MSPDWNIHGQTTFIAQGYPAIRSPYASSASLPGGGQVRETWTADAFLGVRLWDGGAFYFNPELAQGFGLNGTLGLAGFPNGEAQKGGAEFPKFRPQRYYLQQTFGLGGEQEDVADGPLQLAGRRDIDRVTVTVGRFAVGDFFDANAYAKDPRADFMNWAIWSSGAYDFPADLPGMTRGAVIELNRKDWAVRAGAFQVPREPNSDVLVFNGGGGGAVEFEERHSLFGQPGKVRIGAFINRGYTGAYRDAINLAQASPQTDINDAMTALRRNQNKYGFYGNIEQALTTDLGLFARASWNDGRTEILSFTDIDRSISGGFSLKGSAWGRPADTIGVGAAVNGLSSAHRNFLAAGGTGLLIGDGRLRYGHESIVEAYYALRVNGWSTVTFDYQFVANPGALCGAGFFFHALIATTFVIAVNGVLRPLVRLVERQSFAASQLDSAYAISIICHGEAEAHVRALLLRDLAGALHIRDLESTNIEDTNRVQVSATVRADTRQDRLLEQIIGRLSLEPLVTSARWRFEPGE